MNAPRFRWSDDEAEANVPIVPNVPAPPAFPEDERRVLDDDWDDLALAEWLAQPAWASEVEDDSLWPSG